MKKLTLSQLQDRASNKLEAKIFFETKKLQEYKLMADGVIDHGLTQEVIQQMITSQEAELQTYHYIKHCLTFDD